MYSYSCAYLSEVPLNVDENGDIAPRILKLGRWGQVVSYRSQSLYSRGKISGGLQGLSGHFKIGITTDPIWFPCKKSCFVGSA